MFGFIKKMLIGLLSVSTIGSFRESLFPNLKRPINCVSQPWKARPAFINTNSDETLFYPFTVSVNNCGGSCSTIDDSYARVCVILK